MRHLVRSVNREVGDESGYRYVIFGNIGENSLARDRGLRDYRMNCAPLQVSRRWEKVREAAYWESFIFNCIVNIVALLDY